MARFDRENIKSRDLQVLVGTAADDLRQTLERQVREILSLAEQRAAEIERRADQSARERERELEHRAQETVAAVFGRARQVLDSIELVQSALGGMLADLRKELEGLPHPAGASSPLVDSPESGAGLLPGRAKEESLAAAERELSRSVSEPEKQPSVSEQEKPPSFSEPEKQPSGSEPEKQPSGSEQQSPPAQTEPAPIPTKPGLDPDRPEFNPELAAPSAPEREQVKEQQAQVPLNLERQRMVDEEKPEHFDQMIKAEVRNMFRMGKSRAEVEAFLTRFRLGDSYLVMLDDLQAEATQGPRPRREGLLERLRRWST